MKLVNNKIAKSYLLLMTIPYHVVVVVVFFFLQKVDQSNKRTKNSATRRKIILWAFNADDVILNVRKYLIFVVVVCNFGNLSKISSNCTFDEIVMVRNDYLNLFFFWRECN